MSNLSEQSIFTIAHDIGEFKEFHHGETIVNQDTDSLYNFKYQEQEMQALTSLGYQTEEALQVKRQFKNDANPTINSTKLVQQINSDYNRNRAEH